MVNRDAFRMAAVHIREKPESYRYSIVYAPYKDMDSQACQYGWAMAMVGLWGKTLGSIYAVRELGISYAAYESWCFAHHWILYARAMCNPSLAADLLDKFAEEYPDEKPGLG